MAILDDSYGLDTQHNQAAYNSLVRQLPADQTLLWSGQPVQGFLWKRGNLGLGCFGLLFSGFGFSWVFYTFSNPVPWITYLFWSPLLLLGLYMFLGHFFYERWERAHTFYGLTTTTLWIKDGKKVEQVLLTATGHWQHYPSKKRGTWVLRANKDQHAKILAVVGNLPSDSPFAAVLLELEQAVMTRKKS